MKFQKNKILMILGICLTIMLCSFAGIFNNKKVKAASDYVLIVEKVAAVINNSEERDTSKANLNNTITSIENSNIFMLKNANKQIIEQSGNTYFTNEFIKITFMPDTSGYNEDEKPVFKFLLVNAKLNGVAIDTKEVTGDITTETGYSQYYNLRDTKYLYSDQYLTEYEAQGLYEFTFSYMLGFSDGTTSSRNQVTTSFYVLSENYYINPNNTSNINNRDNVTSDVNLVYPYKANKADSKITYNKVYNANKNNTNSITEPRLYNTERIDRLHYDQNYSTEKAFFNFNNLSTTDYNGSATTKYANTIKYPTISFDASKYYVDYSKILYGVTTTVKTEFKIEDDGAYLHINSNGVVSKQKLTEGTVSGTYPVSLELTELGNYTIMFGYIVKTGETEYTHLNTKLYNDDGTLNTAEKTPIEHENWNIIGDIELYVYGYKLNHSVYKNINGASNAELINIADSLYADVTNQNINAGSIAGVTINDTTETKDATYNFTAELTTTTDIISTNQAPLFFSYYASLKQNANNVNSLAYYNRYDSQQKTNLLNGKVYINSNTRFTENGYYEVFLVYDFANYQLLSNKGEFIEHSNRASKVQAFAFTIANVEPDVKLYTYTQEDLSDKIEFNANGYTNKSVMVQVPDIDNKFNVKPEIKVFVATDFNGDNIVNITSQLSAEDLESGLVKVSESGLYIVSISYGPCYFDKNTNSFMYSATITYEFVIDKEVQELADCISVQESKTPTSTYSKYRVLENKIDTIITSSPFTVTFGQYKENTNIVKNGKKLSGATIHATYDYLPIINNGATEILNSNYVKNGYNITSVNVNLEYNQIFESENSITQVDNTIEITNENDVNSIITTDGIYIFHFIDSAGNQATKYVVLDTTAPAIMQTLNGTNYECITGLNTNIVNSDTTLVWGTHKAIELSGAIPNIDYAISQLPSLENDSAKVEKINGNYYILLPIKNVTIKYFNTTDNIANYTMGENFVPSITIKADEISDVTNPNYKLSGEHTYNISITDVNQNTNLAEVEMNFDKSQLQAHITGTATNYNHVAGNLSLKNESSANLVNERVRNNSASNRQKLSIDWLANLDAKYEIGSVICNFYTLTFDKNSPNYPYSANATTTFDLTNDTEVRVIENQQRIASSYINLVYNSNYGDKATMAGMYEVVRTYKNDIDSDVNETSKDSTERKYYFYIDRNGIISYFNSTELIGNEIAIRMNYSSDNKKVFTAEQFLQEYTTAELITTNKLPVTLNIPNYKFFKTDLSQTSSKLYEIIKLNFVVYNEFGDVVYDSNSTNTTPTFTENSRYRVVIFDNTGYGLNLNKESTNLTFEFVIDNRKPDIYFVDQNNIKISNDNPSFNKTEENSVKVVWEEDELGYKANIDQNNMLITKTTENGRKTIVYEIVNGVYTNKSSIKENIVKQVYNLNWNYEIDISKLATYGENCKFEITVQYEGKKETYGEEYFSNTKTVYFDFSAPQYNFDKLLNSDIYLSTEQKINFENNTNDVNFETYAFVVNENYYLEYAPLDNFWNKTNISYNENDLQRAWYRKYDKYSSETGESMQSIVPGDARYTDLSQAPQRLRFDENLKINNKNVYTEFSYIGDANNPVHSFAGDGYYEIIELDCAGNYRVYTIQVISDNNRNIMVDYSKTQFDATTNEDITISGNSLIINNQTLQNPIVIDNKHVVFENINVSDKTFNDNVYGDWFDITVIHHAEKTDTVLETLKYSPLNISGYYNKTTLLAKLNELIAPYDNVNGNYYELVFNTSMFEEFSIEFRKPGKDYELQFEGIQYIKVVIDNTQSESTYLTNFYVYEAVNGVVDYTTPLAKADNNTDIISENLKPNQIYEYTFSSVLEGRNLWFVGTDNFGRQVGPINKILGLTDIEYENMISFDGSYDVIELDGTAIENLKQNKYFEYYTNDDTYLTTQPKMYSNLAVVYYENLEEYLDHTELTKEPIDLSTLVTKTNANGTVTYTLFNHEINNVENVYLITLTDTAGKNYKFVIHYYTKLATVNFVDSSGNKHEELGNNGTISRSIKVAFDKNEYAFETYLTATRTYYDNLGNAMVKNYGLISTDTLLTEHGMYTILAYNNLGTEKVYTFEIRQSSATYFSVLVKPDGITSEAISPSDVKYVYGTQYIDQYFTIYDYEIDVNESKGLIKPTEPVVDGKFTKVYLIKSQENATIPYEKYIAVTKVTANNNFIGNSMIINEDIITTRTAKYSTEKVQITLPAYNLTEGNKLTVTVNYNSTVTTTITDYVLSNDGAFMTFELNDCGVYNIYIKDLAGNQQMFINSKYFTLYVLNNVIYKLNDTPGIVNSVYNDQVSLKIEQESQFDRISNSPYRVAVVATLNGQPYTPSIRNGQYVFSDYGTYIVNMEGIVNGDTENPVITVAKFTILNQNEARASHEYIGLNGYEIISVVRDNEDITGTLKEKLQMQTLNSLAITGGLNAIGGNGHYSIKVKVNYNQIIPSQQFTYNVWINNDIEALILCSLAEGDSTTKAIDLQLNLYQIYSKVGECVIKINGEEYIVINATTATENTTSTYELNQNKRYNITLETDSGNTLLSFVVTKIEPLNSVAIIIIVVISVVVVGLTITFILLRKRMKIK